MSEQDDVRRLADPVAMRALAHPLRLKLLGLLRLHGPATATMLGERLDEVPASASYHLRSLAKHGFVEEVPELATDGRQRWWRAVHRVTSWSSADYGDDPDRFAAAQSLERVILDLYDEQLRTWFEQRPTWSRDWVEASSLSDTVLRLTPDGLRALVEDLDAVVERHRAEHQAEADDPESRVVSVLQMAFPRREGE